MHADDSKALILTMSAYITPTEEELDQICGAAGTAAAAPVATAAAGAGNQGAGQRSRSRAVVLSADSPPTGLAEVFCPLHHHP